MMKYLLPCLQKVESVCYGSVCGRECRFRRPCAQLLSYPLQSTQHSTYSFLHSSPFQCFSFGSSLCALRILSPKYCTSLHSVSHHSHPLSTPCNAPPLLSRLVLSYPILSSFLHSLHATPLYTTEFHRPPFIFVTSVSSVALPSPLLFSSGNASPLIIPVVSPFRFSSLHDPNYPIYTLFNCIRFSTALLYRRLLRFTLREPLVFLLVLSVVTRSEKFFMSFSCEE